MDLIQIFPNVFKATRHHAPSSHPSLARCPWRPVRARPRPHTASACVPCAPPPTAARRPVPRGGLTRAACSSQKLGPRLSLLRRVTTKAGRAEDTEAAPTGHARLRYVAATHATHTHTQRRLAPRAATCHVLKGSVRKGLSAVLRCVARRRAARKLMLRHRPARRRRPLRTLTRCARRASQPDGLRHAPSESSQGDGAEAREDCEPLYAAGAGAGGGRRRGARLRRPRSSRCRRPAGFRPWWRGAGACARRGGGRRSGRRCGGGRRGRGKRRRSDARGGRRRCARARRPRRSRCRGPAGLRGARRRVDRACHQWFASRSSANDTSPRATPLRVEWMRHATAFVPIGQPGSSEQVATSATCYTRRAGRGWRGGWCRSGQRGGDVR